MKAKVETLRLEIVSLNPEELRLYLSGNNLFEKEFRLKAAARIPSADVRLNAQQNIIPRLQEMTEEDQLFLTFWIVIERVTREIVAELGFKGVPSGQGEIEISYGTMYQHRGKGYMTEAVSGMIDWAKGLLNVKFVIAETDVGNKASMKVLRKNNFLFDKQAGKMRWWRKSV
ncbi:MAG TPA: GNAT family N-acetyltransferase [Puia sp.]|nr:GNAT family N-acetyltransferase [Puia sp.]